MISNQERAKIQFDGIIKDSIKIFESPQGGNEVVLVDAIVSVNIADVVTVKNQIVTLAFYRDCYCNRLYPCIGFYEGGPEVVTDIENLLERFDFSTARALVGGAVLADFYKRTIRPVKLGNPIDSVFLYRYYTGYEEYNKHRGDIEYMPVFEKLSKITDVLIDKCRPRITLIDLSNEESVKYLNDIIYSKETIRHKVFSQKN